MLRILRIIIQEIYMEATYDCRLLVLELIRASLT